MINTEKWEHKTYELTCISPIHIGNGELLKQYEYIFTKDRNQQRIYFLDKAKWMTFLVRHDLIDDYAQSVFSGRMNLYGWLQSQRIGSLSAIIREVCNASADVYLVRERQQRVNDISRQVKTPDGVPYIPGSTLKGAIRSAILFHDIRQHPEAYLPFWNRIKAAMEAGNRRQMRDLAQNIERQAFTRLKQQKNRPDDALQSVMKGLAVSDAMLVGHERDTVILQKYDVSSIRREGLKGHPLALFRECIPAGRKFRFSMTLDKDIARLIGITSLDDVWQWVRDYLAFGLAQEKGVFGHEYKGEFEESKLADIRLGGGTGFLSKTVYYALAPNGEGRTVLANFFDDVLFTRRNCHHHKTKDDRLTPRTLKLAWADNDRWILGLAAVKEVASC
ncbi:type III-A CRISPR-associated RAMP protein Csm5 [Megasphaera sp.]|jgi:CRISPR-associated protein Csm5|uniref:type III-A CRISPR-associated RAMP protein Csm5 n=1 Tax=Megasphaera sp. TaxID=2023260 RepID=UPI0025BC2D52|nr:type III-A CRISPR-associated RAMP protein Csm5 [Megasphaera sp.]